MIDVVKASLANQHFFMHEHAQHAQVVVTWYRKANGISSPSSIGINNPYIYPILIRGLF